MSAQTGVILLTGVDSPGISRKLFEALAPFAIEIKDIEQISVQDRFILTVLLRLDKAHAKSIEADLNTLAASIDCDVALLLTDRQGDDLGQESDLTRVIVAAPAPRASVLAELSAQIESVGGSIERIDRIATSPLPAFEFIASGVDPSVFKSAIRQIGRKESISISVMPQRAWNTRKLVVLDVDSTLINEEVIDLLGISAQKGAEIQRITERAMAGELDFANSLQERVALLSGLPESILHEIASRISLTKGAAEVIAQLHRCGHQVALVTGGFIEVIEPLARTLGIGLIRANSLEIENGRLSGKVKGDIVDKIGKAKALEEFASELGIDLEDTVAIGDGANDVEMLHRAGYGIAFCAKPLLQEHADTIIHHRDLTILLPMLGLPISR